MYLMFFSLNLLFIVTDHSHTEVSAANKLDTKWTNQKQYTYRKLTLCLINLLWSPSHIVLLLSWGNWKTPDKSQQRSCLRSMKVPQRHLLDHHKQPGLNWSEQLYSPPRGWRSFLQVKVQRICVSFSVSHIAAHAETHCTAVLGKQCHSRVKLGHLIP